MSNAHFRVPAPYNEPVLTYRPGSPERTDLASQIVRLRSEEVEVPLIIGGKEIKTGNTAEMHAPHDHGLRLGVYHKAGPEHVQAAIGAALAAREEWAAMPWEHRATVFLKMADLLSGGWRQTLNAATMLGQSKTVHQAEIDAVAELVDFWRFNVHFMAELMSDQPYSPHGMWNRVEYRALEGFVFAVTPFNFTSIAGNLATAPAIVGNTVVWKPASSSVYSAWYLMQLFREAGLPDGVINFIPGSGRDVGPVVMASEHLAGIHFTGSTAVFKGMWKTVGDNLEGMRYYPRIVGETGGKDFIFAHESADVDALAVGALRGAFEYQGQKCSAASRMYVPSSIWPVLKDKLVPAIKSIPMGDPADFGNFMGAVIDRAAFDNIRSYVDFARDSDEADILVGGGCDDSNGFFIQPTVIVTTNPHFKTMEEEIFGPVLTVFVYDDAAFDEALDLCDSTSGYALTGAIWARDRGALVRMAQRLRNSAGNFYINDKPTAAVVGQQPFGGGRASGTNDKAGSAMNILRWMTARTIKETMVPPLDWKYPHMSEE
jgi:1-pyrroline-5-carboxylate dehydrogenase